jgi:serine/threonine-protein kinase
LTFGLTPSIIRVTTSGDQKQLVISSAGVTEMHELLTRATGEPAPDHESVDRDAFYLAPELLMREKPDGRTDIFTIGVIGYELLTGRRPFAATTWPELVTAALSGDIGDPRLHAASVPTEAALCLLRCLTPRPDQRFSDVIELENAWRATPL